MILKILSVLLLFNICLYSQDAKLFKSPPDNINLPAIITDENSSPKSAGMDKIDAKWTAASGGSAESLLGSYATSTELGIRQIVKDILVSANIPESKIAKIKINFKSAGTEELSIDKNSVVFKDDFNQKYTGDNLMLVTKLFRTKNAVVELIDESSAEFDASVKDAISGGLRFGNKTETVEGNKMITEIASLVYGYETIPITIERAAETEITLTIDAPKDLSMFSITSILLREGMPYDFFMNITSSALPNILEFKMSDKNPKANFRIGPNEGYTMNYTGKAGQKVTFTISGYKIIV